MGVQRQDIHWSERKISTSELAFRRRRTRRRVLSPLSVLRAGWLVALRRSPRNRRPRTHSQGSQVRVGYWVSAAARVWGTEGEQQAPPALTLLDRGHCNCVVAYVRRPPSLSPAPDVHALSGMCGTWVDAAGATKSWGTEEGVLGLQLALVLRQRHGSPYPLPYGYIICIVDCVRRLLRSLPNPTVSRFQVGGVWSVALPLRMQA